MPFNLRNRSFLKLLDYTPAEISFLLDLSFDLKKAKYNGTEQPRLAGRNIALILKILHAYPLRIRGGSL
jgi:ornithine carbamoyltransferase